MIVVADSSALIALATCECLDVLEGIYDKVIVPQAVFDEVTIKGKSQSKKLEDYLGKRVVDIDLRHFIIEIGRLGNGEIEAMALYKQLSADFLLIDDGRARKVAKFNGINVIGSLGVLLIAKEKGLIKKIKPALNAIRNSEIFMNENLLNKVQRLAGE